MYIEVLNKQTDEIVEINEDNIDILSDYIGNIREIKLSNVNELNYFIEKVNERYTHNTALQDKLFQKKPNFAKIFYKAGIIESLPFYQEELDEIKEVLRRITNNSNFEISAYITNKGFLYVEACICERRMTYMNIYNSNKSTFNRIANYFNELKSKYKIESSNICDKRKVERIIEVAEMNGEGNYSEYEMYLDSNITLKKTK